jgi:hypothetical protein
MIPATRVRNAKSVVLGSISSKVTTRLHSVIDAPRVGAPLCPFLYSIALYKALSLYVVGMAQIHFYCAH